MCGPYDAGLIDAALAVARQENFVAHRGVYVGMLGPTYETRAEYRYLRRIGGHAVGMSTVPEVIAAVHGGVRVLGISTIANVASPDAPQATSGEEVVAVVQSAGNNVAKIIQALIKNR
jgi:purine-nucleoside phosphorylase